MSAKFSTGDIVKIDMPGTAFDGVHALVVKQLVRPYFDGTIVNSDVEIIPLGAENPMMFRAKWLKKISKASKKT